MREIHRLITGRADPAEAGRYSEHQRQILGSPLILPSPAEIPPLMGDFGRWLSQATSRPETISPETAFAAHEGLVSIHPFGNATAARDGS